MKNQDICKELGPYFEPNNKLKTDIQRINKGIDREYVEPLEAILDNLSILGKYDRYNVSEALKVILNYSDEPGINLSEVRQLISEIIENI